MRREVGSRAFLDFAAGRGREGEERIVDEGAWTARGTTHRLLWLEDAGKPWLTVLKRTASGEVYLQSCRRAHAREAGKWRNE